MDRTLAFVTDFACIGGDCEDDCCRGWQVVLDKATATGLQQVLRGTPEGDALAATIAPNPSSCAGDEDFAVIRQDAAGNCPFLQGDGLCGIHGEHGARYLGPVCHTYPRQVMRGPQGAELSLALSCPEAARRCIASAAAVATVEAPSALVGDPRLVISRTAAGDPATPWTRHAPTLREVLWELLSLRDVPLPTRLFFAARFATLVDAMLDRGTSEFDEGRLGALLADLGTDGILDSWAGEFAGLDVPPDLPLQVILTILAGRDRPGTALSEPLAHLWGLCGWGEREDLKGDLARGELGFAQAVAAYTERRQRLAGDLAASHELHLTNVALNHLFRHDVSAAASLSAHVQMLLVRQAMVRLLVACDPRWEEAPADPAGRQELLAAVTVDAVYRSARAVEHDPVLGEALVATFAEQGMTSLAHLVLLAAM